MIKLYRTKATMHSIVWLVVYLAMNTITGNIAGIMGTDNYLVSCVPNFILAAVCFLYLHKTGISREIGLLCKPTESAGGMLFYVPLFILPLYPLTYGINTALGLVDIVSMLLMFAGVAFMEEIIFRGLMFKALTEEWNRVAAVAFVSLTFGIGHIINLIAIGQSGVDTALQIINALAVGFMFMTVVLASGNLTACIIAHFAYNFIVSVCLPGNSNTVIIVNAVITVLYFAYLFSFRKNIKAYFSKSSIS